MINNARNGQEEEEMNYRNENGQFINFAAAQDVANKIYKRVRTLMSELALETVSFHITRPDGSTCLESLEYSGGLRPLWETKCLNDSTPQVLVALLSRKELEKWCDEQEARIALILAAVSERAMIKKEIETLQKRLEEME